MADKQNIKWVPVISRAIDIVSEYDGIVTLRQLFYRLVSEGLIPNTETTYKVLSRKTAQLRRESVFPRLVDDTRKIHRLSCFDGVDDGLRALHHQYRRDRTEGQKYHIYLAVEKGALQNLVFEWFDDYGIPIIILRGYSSQSYVDDVRDDILSDTRESVLLYAGDFDPSGEDIDRDFCDRVEYFDVMRRIALTEDQVITYNLPPQPGKKQDPRAQGFVERHGELVQVELDALPPETLRALFQEALDDLVDYSTLQSVLVREKVERRKLLEYLGEAE